MAARGTDHATFTPGLAGEDQAANHWMRQVTIRLRREICWRWYAREGLSAPPPAALPSPGNRLAESLDLTRYREAKQAFFASDPTAAFLSEQLAVPPPSTSIDLPRGSFAWAVQTLQLDELGAFALALGLVTTFDNAVGPVIAACLDDGSRTQPTLGLVQRLWDEPAEVVQLAQQQHRLWRTGLLQHVGGATTTPDWDTGFITPPAVAHQLLFPGRPLPGTFERLGSPSSELLEPVPPEVVARLLTVPADDLCVVPVLGVRGSPYAAWIDALARASGRDVYRCAIDGAGVDGGSGLGALLTLAWLRGVALFLRDDAPPAAPGDGHGGRRPYLALAALRSIPATVFIAITDRGQLGALPRSMVQPVVSVPTLSYAERLACWRRALGDRAAGLDGVLAECARRFRYEREVVEGIAATLRAYPGPIAARDVFAACRAEVLLDAGELAQPVVPRFDADELVLPAAQQAQLDEVYGAMRSLTEVHYGWGTARAWGESGLSVLFAGPPGTGKTMAAEVLAARLDLPMYRIDLSQVVNKYIGETEKNLKRLFDLADIADVILFFDECDALFGRRTEVRDAHDRYANLEISYLLERMERFKGLAILATNRRKDLDEAFLRRLRYVVEFPEPDASQREAIWRRAVPAVVDTSAVDFGFLARQFHLAGGHIRSIAFNACLQTAHREATARPSLTMERVLVAVKREYDKLKRSVGPEQFGAYAKVVRELTHG